MAEALGIHKQTLLKLRRSKFSPFEEGRDYRWGGLTTGGNLQWQWEKTEESFTNFRRIPASRLETFASTLNQGGVRA
ncbi:hypothetical protein [Synechococcus sp. GFB01]|uniref:hypothetical protein n=1 Tax=Synechococcus sp. GFB01 TaxID=1662190 RepID=UPI00064EB7D0|nr:hypothetical protein [Synechococcus sp. GFB01]KMM17126.1 hypothetical protein SYNGFB01_06130 [Synechococcus sp. GFB01]